MLTRFASRPAIRYGVSGLLGAIYGALAEESGNVTSGFGTSFGNLLFTSANLLSTPALRLALSSDDDAVKSLPPPFSGHVIYGVTTELVRRLTRSALEGIG